MALACVFFRLIDVCTSVWVWVYVCCAFAGQCFAGCVCYKPPFCGCPSFADVSHLMAFPCFFFQLVFFRIVFSRLCSHSRWPPGVCSGGGLWRPRTDPVETYLLWGLMYCMHLYLLVCVCLLCIIVWTLAFALHAFSSKLVPATAKWLTKVCSHTQIPFSGSVGQLAFAPLSEKAAYCHTSMPVFLLCVCFVFS